MSHVYLQDTQSQSIHISLILFYSPIHWCNDWVKLNYIHKNDRPSTVKSITPMWAYFLLSSFSFVMIYYDYDVMIWSVLLFRYWRYFWLFWYGYLMLSSRFFCYEAIIQEVSSTSIRIFSSLVVCNQYIASFSSIRDSVLTKRSSLHYCSNYFSLQFCT